MELALKESNKLKKGRKKKEDRTESKRKQNVRSKGFDELPRGSRTAATNNDYSSVFVFAAILVLCAGQIPQLCREPHRFRWLVSVFQVILDLKTRIHHLKLRFPGKIQEITIS